jgi:nucleolar protein 4
MMEKSKNKSSNAADPRTLFVKFFPPSASITRQHLSDHFSNYGPVNKCSVIRQTKNTKDGDDNRDRGSKGYGFVRFVNEEDAKAAARAIREKSDGKKRKNQGEVMTVDGIQYKIHAELASDAASAGPANKARDGHKHENSASDAAGLDETTLTKRKRNARVIIRNLSFYANEKHIKKAMESEFGQVLAVDLPLVPALPKEDSKSRANVPRHRGFAFVTFANAVAARKAVERGNEIEIKNRLVAIDFSVSKMVHQKMLKEDEQKKEEESDDEEEESKSGDEDESKSGSESEGSGSDDESKSSQDEEKDSDEESTSDSEEDDDEKDDTTAKEAKQAKKEVPEFDESESKRTLFLRNIPFDATRKDVFDLFREFGRIQAVYLVKDPQTGVFRGTAFVRFETEKSCSKALEASGKTGDGGESSTFVSSKNMVMGLGDGNMSGLSLKGRHILVDLAVDRSTASSLAVQRDADGKPIKKMVGKDRRNLYLKNEGRVSSSTDSAIASSAGARHGGVWEDLPQSDRAKRERVFADKSTKLRSPLFFINPTRLSIRNLAKHVTESDLKRLVTEALKTGLAQKLVTGNDAVAHWRAGGELPHSEIMLRAADPKLVTPPFDEKNTKESIPSVFIDRDFSGGQKSADAPSRGFGFVEFTHHTHALACLRQLNNNPAYSQEFVAGGKQAAELVRQQQKKGKKSKKAKVDEESGGFVGDDGKVCVPRLIVEFAVSCAMNYMFFLMRHVTNILPYRLRIWSRPGSRQRNCSKRKPTRSNKGLKARRRSQQRRRRKRRAAVHCNEKRNELERRQARKSLS